MEPGSTGSVGTSSNHRGTESRADKSLWSRILQRTSEARSNTMTRAKNILFITSDEMRGDVQSYIGNPDVKTPNLDALAARGCVFERHFSPFPKCVPARCAMHTGRYTHTDGLRSVMEDNHLPRGTPTMGEFLRDQGYETAVFGLNHIWEREWFYGAGDQVNKKSAGVVDYQSFTENLGKQVRKDNILMTVLCPGGIDTPLWGEGDDFRYSLGRENMIRPEEVAELIDYILQQPRRTLFKNVVFVPTVEAW
jgi:phosphoglycerol transferase MdoB-like AlkP superfamily enzyme